MDMEENSGAAAPKKRARKATARKTMAKKSTAKKSASRKSTAKSSVTPESSSSPPRKERSPASGSRLVNVAKTIGSTMGTLATRTRRAFKRGG